MKKRRIKRSIVLILAAVMVFTFVVMPRGTGSVYADTYDDQINAKEGELEDVKGQQEQLEGELAQVKKDIQAAQAKVDNINAAISSTAKEIEDTQNAIVQKEADIESQQENLDARLVVMYKNGSVGFLDVLLGSNSISEFVSNVEMIQKVYRNDMEVLQRLQKEQEELNALKVSLSEKIDTLNAQKEEAKVLQDELASKKAIIEAKEVELKAQADALVAEIKKLQDEQRIYEGGVFTWPCPSSHYITYTFGYRYHPVFGDWRFHTGIDISCYTGADIIAAASGKVIMAQWYGGYGNCVMIDHGSGIVTLYGHASSLCVSQGQEVQRGQLIMKAGSTGWSTGPHLHFEVRLNGEYVDPLGYF
ncbi:MAG: peptidoglycan DD-metalloendopeptidase family protein [Firmicutes bacterium]|nr:peptidoglycan DD-metalloendopeptidase family protein [Bacillota bacterium]